MNKDKKAVSPQAFLAIAGAGVAAFLMGADVAHASQPVDWQLGFQESVTPVMDRITNFHNNWLMPLITVISLFVLALLIYVMFRFNARSNPTPSNVTHNVLIEVVWTIVPVLILVAIAFPSISLLYYQDRIPEADITIKAIGHQWYWEYEYPDHGGFFFEGRMVPDEDLKEGQPRLLATDNNVVLPVGKTIRVQVTSTDVLHAFAVPAFGVKIDAVPGRLNEIWFNVDKEGIYYGQCSELCGVEHAFMPIAVEVVSEQKFAAWVASAQREFGGLDVEPATIDVAAKQD